METLFLKNEDIFKFYDCIAGSYELYVPVKVSAPLRSNASTVLPYQMKITA